MVFVWAVKMRLTIWLLLSAVCVLADKNGNSNRRTKPFIADAVGNTLPPPSNVPATVGSPINLLTPDRYEFYTFDESGELVKRLMTLEEIQAIVAAGEESEGLVTVANDNRPTVAFNFSQPPYTKVHSVVTNVQNVLKAQMEAHKNKPLLQPTLDTPDVSNTWSLILPSIFGNSGGDIVPDKPASSFTPETETIEDSFDANGSENSLSKEGGSQVSTAKDEDQEVKLKPVDTAYTDTTTTSVVSSTPTTTTTKLTTTRKITTTSKPHSTTTIRKKLVTTTRPRTTTTKVPTTTRPSTTTTTVKPIITSFATKTTTTKPVTVSKKQTTETAITTLSNDIPTANPITQFERISTFIPISTVKYVTERTSQEPVESTKAPFVYAATTKRSPSTSTRSPQPLSTTPAQKLGTTVTTPIFSTNKFYVTTDPKESELDRVNLTTITTQSVSPSTTVSSTEFLSLEHSQSSFTNSDLKDDDPVLPLFDVAQSISQIASDLGNNYQPIPTASSTMLDTTKLNAADMESKENLDMDIPNYEPVKNKNEENFIKISTIDPHPQDKNQESDIKTDYKESPKVTTEVPSTTENFELTTLATILSEGTTMDPILTESMGDLLSQVVQEAPQTIIDTEKSNYGNNNNTVLTTEKIIDTTTGVVLDIQPTTTSQKIFVNEVKNVDDEMSTEKQKNGNKSNLIEIQTSTVKNPVLKETTENTPTKIITDIETLFNVTTGKEDSTTESTNTKKESHIQVINEKEAPASPTFENISKEKELPKIESIVNNKINTNTVNKNEKENEFKDFVKISVPSTVNSSNIESNHHKDEILTITDNTEKANKTVPQKQINDTDQRIKVPAVDVNTSTNSPKTDITTKPTKLGNTKNNSFSLSQSNIFNKISIGDKTNLNNKKDQIIEHLPKIDEFKKKIQKVNDEELANDRNDPWKLIPAVIPPNGNDISKDKLKQDSTVNPTSTENKDVILEFSNENQGLEVTTKDLGEDIAQFTELCNELAFRYWNTMVENIDKKRSFVLSPYSITSMLAMMFMGARGATSGEMNEILKLDDMVTFNPHFTLKNISDSIESATDSGITISAFVRELFSDRNKGKILTFYKERAQHFYGGHVEEINFKLISDIIRRRTNLLVKKHTWGKIPEYMKTNSIVMNPPLAAFSTNIYQTDCTGTSVDGRDGEMYFVVSPNVRQRRLVPVPAVVYKSGFLAGYDPVLDATAAALGNTNSIVSTMFLMPGQQGNIVHADDLVKLEQRLLEANPTTTVWNRVLRTLLPRVGLELQIPRFSHKSVFNVSSTLREMGLKDLFDADHADLGGLNGPSKDLYLSDMIQMTSFVTCGEGMVSDQHHVEEYPEIMSVARRRTSRWADWDEPRDYQRAFHDPHDVGEAMHLPLHLRPRQARLPTRSVQPARLKFDRPFLFFVRHNPSGMILYVGRYNPRLLP